MGNFLIVFSILLNTHISSATQSISITPLLCRHTLTGLISSSMTPHCLLSLILSFACITSLVNLCHLEYCNIHCVLHSHTGHRVILLPELSTYLSSTQSTHTNRCPLFRSIPWLSCIFIPSPVADYRCLLHCQNFPSPSCFTERLIKQSICTQKHTRPFVMLLHINIL